MCCVVFHGHVLHVVCPHDGHICMYVRILYLADTTAVNITLYSEGFMNGFILVISTASTAAEN